MIKVVYAGILLAGLSPSLSIAAPAVIGASGSPSMGGAATISGSGFGSHPMQIESLQSNIEAGTTGQELSKTGWLRSDWAQYGSNPLYATDSAHSGNKSIKCAISGNCAFAYDMPDVAAGQRFYATWWVKYNGPTNGQWKMFRASGLETIVDNSQQANLYNWFTLQRQIVINPGKTGERALWLGESAFPRGDNTWYRVEVDFKAGNTNTPNGELTLRTTSDSGVIGYNTYSDVNTHITSGDNWKYAIWQNYAGNGITGATVWLDDIYVQYNTPARVELCTGSTWAARGKCEIQVPTNWSSTSIAVTTNTGSFATGQTAYVYVVDSAGDANSSGYAVTIGESGGGGTTITCYQDADNDGYGHGVSETVETCSSGYYIASHFTALTGDANDNDASIYPGSSPSSAPVSISGAVQLSGGVSVQ